MRSMKLPSSKMGSANATEGTLPRFFHGAEKKKKATPFEAAFLTSTTEVQNWNFMANCKTRPETAAPWKFP